MSGSSGASGSFELNVGHFQGLAGTITREDTGGALSGATVSLFDDFGFLVDDRVTGTDGSYSFDGLTDGTYYVRAEADGMIDELYDDVPCEPSCDFSEGIALPVVLNGSILGVDFALAPCPVESLADIRTTLYLSAHTEEACERISAGTDTAVATGADVTFKAGRSVVLEDGFAVQAGAGFRVVIEPEWADD